MAMSSSIIVVRAYSIAHQAFTQMPYIALYARTTVQHVVQNSFVCRAPVDCFYLVRPALPHARMVVSRQLMLL